MERALNAADKTLQKADRTAKKATASTDRLAESSDRAAEKIRETGEAARRFSTQGDAGVASIKRLAAGFLSLEVARRVVSTAFRAASATLTEFVSNSADAQQQVADLAREAGVLQRAFADAALGAGNFDDLIAVAEQGIAALEGSIAAVTPALNGLVGDVIDDLSELSQGLTEANGDLETIANGARAAYSAVLALADTTRAFLDLLNPLDAMATAWSQLGAAIRGEVGFGEAAIAITEDAIAFDAFASAADNAARALSALSSEYPNLSVENEVTESAPVLWDMVGALVEWGVTVEEAAPSTRSFARDLEALKSSAELTAESLRAVSEGAKGATELQALKSDATAQADAAAETDRLVASKRREAQAEADAARIAAEEATLLKMKELGEQQSDAALERMSKLKDRLGAGAGIAADGIGQIAQSLGEAAASGDADALKDSLKGMLGDILMNVGKTQIALGTMNLIPPPFNPQGNPAIGVAQIAGGAAAVALGGALGASGGGGAGGGAGSPGPGAVAPTQTNETYIANTMSAGVIIDGRGAIKEFNRMQDDASRHGVR